MNKAQADKLLKIFDAYAASHDPLHKAVGYGIAFGAGLCTEQELDRAILDLTIPGATCDSSGPMSTRCNQVRGHLGSHTGLLHFSGEEPNPVTWKDKPDASEEIVDIEAAADSAVVDLMAALEESIAKAKQNRPDFRPLFGPHTWQICEACNYGTHHCHFCGDDLSHTESQPMTYREREPHACYAELFK